MSQQLKAGRLLAKKKKMKYVYMKNGLKITDFIFCGSPQTSILKAGGKLLDGKMYYLVEPGLGQVSKRYI